MEALARLKQRLNDFLWGAHPGRPRWQALVADQMRLAVCIGRDLASGQLTLRAMGLVFTTLLSLVPLIAVSFSALKGLGVHNRVEPMLERALAPLGERAAEVTDRVIGFVDNVEVGVLGAVGTAFLVIAAVSLVQQIESAFNYTWDVGRARTLVRRFSDYLSLLVIGPIVVVAATGGIASLVGSALVQDALTFQPLATLWQLFGGASRFLFLALAFTVLYLIIPNTRVRVGPALYGGVVAGVAWELVGRVFAAFVVGSTSYAAVYSGFAILLLFMVWLNLAWLIVLVGSSVAFYRQHPARRAGGGRRGAGLAPAQCERVALAVILAIVEDWRAGRAPDTAQLAERAGAAGVAVDRVLDALLAAGLIVPGGTGDGGYLPARPPERTSVKQVLDAVRHSRDEVTVLGGGATVRRTMETVERALDDATGSTTLASLVTEEQPEDRPSGADL